MLRLYAIIGGMILLILAGLTAITITWIAPQIPYQNHEIAFLSLLDGWRLVRYDLDRNAYFLVDSSKPIEGFDWSPDGQQMVVAYRNEIEMIDLATGDTQELIANAEEHYFSPRWSPDGEHIAFFSTRIGILNETRSITRAYVTDGETLLEIPNASSFLAWSPDGNYVAYVDQNLVGSIALFNIETETVSSVSISVAGGDADWSPDRRWLAFWQASQTTRIAIYDLQQGRLSNSIQHPDYNYLSPDWSPNSERLVMMANDFRNDESEIHVSDRDGNIRQRITQFTYVAYPRWRP